METPTQTTYEQRTGRPLSECPITAKQMRAISALREYGLGEPEIVDAWVPPAESGRRAAPVLFVKVSTLQFEIGPRGARKQIR